MAICCVAQIGKERYQRHVQHGTDRSVQGNRLSLAGLVPRTRLGSVSTGVGPRRDNSGTDEPGDVIGSV